MKHFRGGRALTVLLGCVLAAPAAAQTWPARPVRIIVPFAPGGGVDTVTRFMAQKLTEQTGGSFIVENRPGGGGILGAELVAKAPPDGHTLFTSAPEFSVNPSLRAKMPYDTFRDFSFISQLTSGQFMIASHPNVPVRSVRDLIAVAKSRPGQLTYGTSGVGSINHLAGELLKSMSGARWVHIPYKGAAPASVAVMGGETDFVIASTTGLVNPVRAGKMRAIAVTGTARFTGLPDLPTVAESGVPGYAVTGWYGFYAPAGTPAAIVKRLNEESRRGLMSPEIRERLVQTGNEPVGSTPEEFTAFVRAEIVKWAKVVRSAGMTAE
jgi:tripartite-type tricarboxylate transporter receptor subunit TctC